MTLLAFGDSLTQGYGLEVEEGFVPQLEAWLRERGAEVTVINGGVSGDTTAGGAARIAWSLTDDVDAVMVTLGGNDLLRGLSPDQTRANLARIIAAVQARDLPVLLVGMKATGNFGAAYKAKFDAIYPELAAETGAAFFPHFLQGLVDLGDQQLVLRDYMQPDATHPNAAGVTRIVNHIGPAVLKFLDQTESN